MISRSLRLVAIATIAAPPPLEQDIELKVLMTNNTNTVSDAGGLNANDVSQISGGEHKLSVPCSGEDCNKLGVKFGGTSPCIVSNKVCEGKITVDPKTPGKLVIDSNGTAFFNTTLSALPPGGGKKDDETETRSLSDLLKTPCNISYSGHTYDRATDQAVFVTDILGNVKFAPTENVDENDKIKVIVWADTRLHPLLHVFRKSAIRQL